jgi:hypothetical protein
MLWRCAIRREPGHPIAVLGKRPFPPHRRQQRIPNTRQPLILEASKFSLDHATQT